MNVDVDELVREVEVDDADRIAARLKDAAISEGDRAREGAIAHRAAVDEDREPGGAGAGSLGSGDEGLDAERAALAAAGRELLAGVHVARALFTRGGAEPLFDDAAVAREHERHRRLAERCRLRDLGHVRRLGGQRAGGTCAARAR